MLYPIPSPAIFLIICGPAGAGAGR